jgi:ankyrin repeat protein
MRHYFVLLSRNSGKNTKDVISGLVRREIGSADELTIINPSDPSSEFKSIDDMKDQMSRVAHNEQIDIVMVLEVGEDSKKCILKQKVPGLSGELVEQEVEYDIAELVGEIAEIGSRNPDGSNRGGGVRIFLRKMHVGQRQVYNNDESINEIAGKLHGLHERPVRCFIFNSYDSNAQFHGHLISGDISDFHKAQADHALIRQTLSETSRPFCLIAAGQNRVIYPFSTFNHNTDKAWLDMMRDAAPKDKRQYLVDGFINHIKLQLNALSPSMPGIEKEFEFLLKSSPDDVWKELEYQLSRRLVVSAQNGDWNDINNIIGIYDLKSGNPLGIQVHNRARGSDGSYPPLPSLILLSLLQRDQYETSGVFLDSGAIEVNSGLSQYNLLIGTSLFIRSQAASENAYSKMKFLLDHKMDPDLLITMENITGQPFYSVLGIALNNFISVAQRAEQGQENDVVGWYRQIIKLIVENGGDLISPCRVWPQGQQIPGDSTIFREMEDMIVAGGADPIVNQINNLRLQITEDYKEYANQHPNSQTKTGNTPLHILCAMGEVDAAIALIDRGAIWKNNSAGQSPRDIFELYYNGADKDGKRATIDAVVETWKDFKEKQTISFLAAHHPRFGEHSPVQVLPNPDVTGKIIGHLITEDPLFQALPDTNKATVKKWVGNNSNDGSNNGR